ncbi:MAG: YdcF family protein [Lachnospiraceae bacterium]|nr:YdcF family protein [Lachnospiraceae bacterium]
MSAIVPYLYLGLGGFFFLYFILLWMHCGRIPAFGWFWSFIGSIMTVLGLFTKDHSLAGPDGIMTVFYDENLFAIRVFCIEQLPYILLILTAAFLLSAYVLSSHGKRQPSKNTDYLIVLGAHVNGTIPSRALLSRITAAYEYMRDNPSTKAVLTGGQGRDEHITEAACMKQEFIKLGIEEARLLMEDRSTTTEENIIFAKNIILQKEISTINITPENNGTNLRMETHDRILNKKVFVIVSNDFHTLRGTFLAKKAGFMNVESIGTSSSLIMKPHYYTRETLSWIKLGVLLLVKR